MIYNIYLISYTMFIRYDIQCLFDMLYHVYVILCTMFIEYGIQWVYYMIYNNTHPENDV